MMKAYSYVRFSTPNQLLGDSQRRQLDASRTYATEHGLELVDELLDLGISAFRGKNVAEGALGAFLDAVKAGKIERGSWLIVESLDRLSRQEVTKALTLFLEIINSGVTIHTLADDQTYTPGRVELTGLIVSLVSMSRSHEESKIKGQRVAAAWANKRASGKPMTAMCPSWLRLESGEFVVIEERARVVRAMFEDHASGLGIYLIVKRLNQEKVPTFARSPTWGFSTVAKYLSSRAVLGELVAKGRPTIVGYYPAIVDEELWHRARADRAARRRGGGPRGVRVSNVFTSVAKCGNCGSSMLLDHGSLICLGAKRGHGCAVMTRWPYVHFERQFLRWIEEIELESLVRTDDKRAELDRSIQSLEGRRIEVTQERDKLLQVLLVHDADYIVAKLKEVEARVSVIEAELREKTDERASAIPVDGLALKELIKHLQSQGADTVGGQAEDRSSLTDPDHLFKMRALVASRIRSLVESLVVTVESEVGRWFVVEFRSGGTHVVFDN